MVAQRRLRMLERGLEPGAALAGIGCRLALAEELVGEQVADPAAALAAEAARKGVAVLGPDLALVLGLALLEGRRAEPGRQRRYCTNGALVASLS